MNKVTHLHLRAGFGFESLNKESNYKKVVNSLLRPTGNHIATKVSLVDMSTIKAMSKDKKKELKKKLKLEANQVQLDWINLMITSVNPLEEQMTLFLTNHFVVNHKRGYRAKNYNNLLRKHALGNLKSCAKAVFKHPAMIDYLHLKQNKKESPNEDFARELMELFTLGRDVLYTQKDIIEVARAFTGWSYDADENFKLNTNQHDNSAKLIFGEDGNFGGNDVIDLIFSKKECASWFSKKLCTHFLSENAEQKEKLENQLATKLYESDYDIKESLSLLLNSDFFWRDRSKKIKSPVQHIVGIGKHLKLTYINHKQISRILKALGMSLFAPPNVAGWPGGKHWIDSTRLVLRMNLGAAILNKKHVEVENTDPLDTNPEEVNTKTIKKYRIETSKINIPNISDSYEWFQESTLKKYKLPTDPLRHHLAQFSLPEYQIH